MVIEQSVCSPEQRRVIRPRVLYGSRCSPTLGIGFRDSQTPLPGCSLGPHPLDGPERLDFLRPLVFFGDGISRLSDS